MSYGSPFSRLHNCKSLASLKVSRREQVRNAPAMEAPPLAQDQVVEIHAPAGPVSERAADVLLCYSAAEDEFPGLCALDPLADDGEGGRDESLRSAWRFHVHDGWTLLSRTVVARECKVRDMIWIECGRTVVQRI